MQTVIRYVGHPGNAYDLTVHEAAALRKAGLGVVFVYEAAASWMLAGHAAGVAAAKAAKAHVHTLGGPASPVVYFAADFDAEGAQDAKVLACVAGAATVLSTKNAGLYGGGNLLAKAQRRHPLSLAVREHVLRIVVARPHSAGAGRQVGQPGIQSYDTDEQLVEDVGQWGYVAPKPKPVPVPKVPNYVPFKRAVMATCKALKISDAGMNDADTFGDSAKAAVLRLAQKAPQTPPKGVDYRPLKAAAVKLAGELRIAHSGVNTANTLGEAAKTLLRAIAAHR